MQALTSYLRKASDQNPTASYYNVDILKYQVSEPAARAQNPGPEKTNRGFNERFPGSDESENQAERKKRASGVELAGWKHHLSICNL